MTPSRRRKNRSVEESCAPSPFGSSTLEEITCPSITGLIGFLQMPLPRQWVFPLLFRLPDLASLAPPARPPAGPLADGPGPAAPGRQDALPSPTPVGGGRPRSWSGRGTRARQKKRSGIVITSPGITGVLGAASRSISLCPCRLISARLSRAR